MDYVYIDPEFPLPEKTPVSYLKYLIKCYEEYYRTKDGAQLEANIDVLIYRAKSYCEKAQECFSKKDLRALMNHFGQNYDLSDPRMKKFLEEKQLFVKGPLNHIKQRNKTDLKTLCSREELPYEAYSYTLDKYEFDVYCDDDAKRYLAILS